MQHRVDARNILAAHRQVPAGPHLLPDGLRQRRRRPIVDLRALRQGPFNRLGKAGNIHRFELCLRYRFVDQVGQFLRFKLLRSRLLRLRGFRWRLSLRGRDIGQHGWRRWCQRVDDRVGCCFLHRFLRGGLHRWLGRRRHPCHVADVNDLNRHRFHHRRQIPTGPGPAERQSGEQQDMRRPGQQDCPGFGHLTSLAVPPSLTSATFLNPAAFTSPTTCITRP